MRKKYALDAVLQIEYDIKMLIGCITEIYSGEKDEITLNALKESAMLHFKNLYGFFKGRPAGDSDNDEHLYYFDLKKRSFETNEREQALYEKIRNSISGIARYRKEPDEIGGLVYYELFTCLADAIFAF